MTILSWGFDMTKEEYRELMKSFGFVQLAHAIASDYKISDYEFKLCRIEYRKLLKNMILEELWKIVQSKSDTLDIVDCDKLSTKLDNMRSSNLENNLKVKLKKFEWVDKGDL